MAPILLRGVSSGDHVRQLSRSIPKSLPMIPIPLQRHDIPAEIYASIHRSTPIIPRAVHYIANFLASTWIGTPASLTKRQGPIRPIPATYAGLNDGPTPGAVAGIVIGSVGGFLLVLWLLYTCLSMGGLMGAGGEVVEEEIVRRRSRSPRRRRSHSETIEITKSRSPPRRERERVVVEETRRVSRPSEPDPVEPVDDIVEVIEENSVSPSPPPRRTSKRSSGYRTVDPAEFGGGGRSMRRVR